MLLDIRLHLVVTSGSGDCLLEAAVGFVKSVAIKIHVLKLSLKVVIELGRLRQEDCCEFQASLAHRLKLY